MGSLPSLCAIRVHNYDSRWCIETIIPSPTIVGWIGLFCGVLFATGNVSECFMARMLGYSGLDGGRLLSAGSSSMTDEAKSIIGTFGGTTLIAGSISLSVLVCGISPFEKVKISFFSGLFFLGRVLYHLSGVS